VTDKELLLIEYVTKAPEIAALIKRIEEENKRLREAVEWAIQTIHTERIKGHWGTVSTVGTSKFIAELRRRAKEGK
jgi:hypothetical protein